LTESNNNYFSIEKSPEGKGFDDIAMINGLVIQIHRKNILMMIIYIAGFLLSFKTNRL